jgi:hydroxypyruvate reductase
LEEVLKALRRDALLVFEAGLKAASPEDAIRRALHLENETLRAGERACDLKAYRSIYLLGAGKASARMAGGVLGLLGDEVTGGVVSVPYGQSGSAGRVKLMGASHPEPNEDTLANTALILDVAEKASRDDLVICLISGGGSSLLEALPHGVSLPDIVKMNRALLASGADIVEINTVRKHVSEVKGGKLAARIYPASLINLVVSDVPGDDLTFIASGPTVGDSTTFDDCIRIIERLGLAGEIPDPVMRHLENGAAGRLKENPRTGDRVFKDIQSLVIAGNSTSVEAASDMAGKIGYKTVRLDEPVVGDTRDAARHHAGLARKMIVESAPVAPPACIVSGGETTVRVMGEGKGGRNQEFAIASAIQIDGLPIAVLSAGTDGIDGATDAAGAICDGHTLKRANDLGIDALSYLGRNDSYSFFSRLGDLVKTGPTGTNVMDVHIIMVGCT